MKDIPTISLRMNAKSSYPLTKEGFEEFAKFHNEHNNTKVFNIKARFSDNMTVMKTPEGYYLEFDLIQVV